MSWLTSALGAFFAASMCGVLFNVRGKDLVCTGGIAAAAALMQQAARAQGADPVLSTFYAGLTFGILSELLARIFRTPVTTYLPSVLIPFVPGRMMLYMMGEIVQGQQSQALGRFIEILSIAGALAMAILLSSTLIRLCFRILKVLRQQRGQV